MVQGATSTGNNKKKRKVKATSYTPTSTLLPGSSSSRSNLKQTMHATKLKNIGGRFTVSHAAHVSEVNPPNTTAKTGQTDTRPVVWDEIADTNGWDPGYIESLLEQEVLPPQGDEAPPKKGRGDKVIHDWTKEVEAYLKTLLTMEGRGGVSPSGCTQCKSEEEEPIYRCQTCDHLGLLCKSCMVSAHKHLPLHQIQDKMWNGQYFSKISLKSLGLRIQLGHPPGEFCPVPNTAWNDDFVILDVDAVHCVSLDYCGCLWEKKGQVTQLLERRLYPATVTNPKTAATFRLLEVLELLQYESKITAFEFFQTISRLTDNTGLKSPKDRYPSLLRMIHEWRYLKLLKRSGRGHDATRPASQTLPGECALLCPACPHPNINLPEGWENEPPETRYIHGLNLALDCNFRLKRKNVSDDAADPGLNKGCAYIVEDIAFRKFLDDHAEEVEPKSTCSRHDAVNLADTKPGQGYAASGVGTVECARHNSKRPNAVCDVQKGERYCNMDYIIVMSLLSNLLQFFLISYDIACQWYIRLLERLTAIDKDCVLLRPDVTLRFVVPKFHLPAHIPACRDRFAFMLTPGAGLGDGEAPERGWGESNPLGPSTREMGPGSRRDTLDAHFGDYNWRKIVKLGSSLLKKMKTATSDVAEHVIAHQELESSLQPEQVALWQEAVEAWENDPSKPNPYETIVKTPTQAAVRKQLAEEEAKALQEGKDFSMTDEVSPSNLIAWGIDLESEQRALKVSTNKVWNHSQDRELTRIQLRSNVLTRKIETWYRLLQLYIPSTVMLRERYSGKKSIPPYDIPLWLPSGIGKLGPMDSRLADIEFRLRDAQSHEALGTLRRNLQMRATLFDVKDRWLRGQGANTRALNSIATVEARISAAASEYRQTRLALLTLADVLGRGDVQKSYPVLEKEDIRSMNEGKEGKGETRRSLSWIWRHGEEIETEDDGSGYVLDTIRVEWGKSRARSHRHLEEINIVREEMSRTIRFFQWKEKIWLERGNAQREEPLEAAYAEGLRAYAQRQADICQHLGNSFASQWSGVDDMIQQAKTEFEDPQVYYQRRERDEAGRRLQKNKKLSLSTQPDPSSSAEPGQSNPL